MFVVERWWNILFCSGHRAVISQGITKLIMFYDFLNPKMWDCKEEGYTRNIFSVGVGTHFISNGAD